MNIAVLRARNGLGLTNTGYCGFMHETLYCKPYGR